MSRRPLMGSALQINLKAVPGARRDEVVGWLGDRLKVRVSAPPEGGRANAAIRALLAAELGVAPSAITITRGHGTAEKSVLIEGVTREQVEDRWPRM